MKKINRFFNSKMGIRLSLVLLVVLMQGLYVSVSAQTKMSSNSVKGENIIDKKVIDNGYFKYEVTGNENRDIEVYRVAKDQFIRQFPEKYKEMLANSKSDAKHIIDKVEFEKMPPNKRSEILSHPEKYVIQ